MIHIRHRLQVAQPHFRHTAWIKQVEGVWLTRGGEENKPCQHKSKLRREVE